MLLPVEVVLCSQSEFQKNVRSGDRIYYPTFLMNLIIQSHIYSSIGYLRVVHGSDGPTGRFGSGRGRVGSGRVGSGRVGSGWVTILPDFGVSGRVSTSDCLVFY